MRIFAISLLCEIRLKFRKYSLLNEYFEANTRVNLMQIFALKRIFAATSIYLHEIGYLYANLGEYLKRI
jgi:hypothetical protein